MLIHLNLIHRPLNNSSPVLKSQFQPLNDCPRRLAFNIEMRDLFRRKILWISRGGDDVVVPRGAIVVVGAAHGVPGIGVDRAEVALSFL